MLSFTYDALPSRVVFGVGAVEHVAEEMDRLGVRKALVLCTAEQWGMAGQIMVLLGDNAVGLFDRAVMHVPVEVAQAARDEAWRVHADCCVAIGGGSTTGLAKAIALTSDLPIIAIPTTYAGSEMTPIWGLTEGGVKRTGRDARVLPKTVIYDPALTLGLPVPLSVTSGINAIAHCVEALYSRDANPIISLMAEDAIAAMARALPAIVKNPGDEEARGRALYGAWLGGVALGAVGMALHHKLCHTLGGSFHLPHAEAHTVVLPHATAYNASEAAGAMARVARALSVGGTVVDAAGGLWDLAAALGAPTSLEAIGMQRADLDRAADLASENPYWNPRRITRDGIRALLENAFNGQRPEVPILN
ncbi:MAG: maleylacetate reductase [Acidobacteriota bacterium]